MADDTERKEGLAAAVETAHELWQELRQEQAAEQLPLLPSLAARETGEEAEQRAGPGRPRGSRNRRTQEWVDYLLARYPSPLVALAETYSRPTAELATELACKRDEAFKLQLMAARELAPYLHQKQPVAVEVDARGEVNLVISGFDGLGETIGQGAGATVIEGTFEDEDEDDGEDDGEDENG